MKILIMFLAALFPFVGFSQLVLPEFMGPDQGGGADTGIVSEPGDQRHAQPGEEGDGEGKEGGQAEKEEQEVGELMNMMDRLRGTQVSLSPEQLKQLQKNHQPMDKLEKIYLSGPAHVRAKVFPLEGSVIQGKVENMTCQIKTAVGLIPVRLHEIIQAERLENGEGFALELAGGDYVEGEFSNLVLLMRMPDGSERELTEKKLTKLEFKKVGSR